jgi:hypothetical protein
MKTILATRNFKTPMWHFQGPKGILTRAQNALQNWTCKCTFTDKLFETNVPSAENENQFNSIDYDCNQRQQLRH